MSETWFSDNFQDLSHMHGVNAGFQFEFYCERCHNAYRTPFQPYRAGQAAGWLGRASGLLGGVLGQADNAVGGLAEQGWAKARDEQFREAVVEAKQHFNRCSRCFQYVCDTCFNKAKGLCYNCAPDVQVEIEAARNAGEIQSATESAIAEGMQRGAQRDVARDQQLVCPACNAETHGAKFCPECGTKLAVNVTCGGCGTESPAGTKFCPECGNKLPA